MGKPRVVVFTPVYPPRKGGSATYFGNLVEKLKDRVDFTVITLEGENGNGDVDVRRVLPDRFSSSPPERYLSVLPSTFSALSRVRKEGRYIMHIHSNGIYGYSASLYSRMKSIPILKEVQDTSDPGWVLKSGKVHRWVATGRYVERRLKGFSIPAERIITFPSINPPSTERIAKELKDVKKPDVTRFVYVGWLMNRVKGVDLLIRAFEKASEKSDMELIIIGDGPDRKELEDMAGSLPVDFTGELPYRETLKKIAASHALVLPSHEEANPRVILEAYSVSVPVIATDVGGVSEEVTDGRTGILVPPDDVDELSTALLKMASERDMLDEMGSEGRRFLKGLPDWNELSETIYENYLEMWG